MTRSARAWLLTGVSLTTIACVVVEEERSDSDFSRLEFRRVSSAPGFVSLGDNEITIERGLAVNARVSAIGDDGQPMDLLRLKSTDEDHFIVDKGPRLGEYVFYGPRAGAAEVEIYSDERFKATVPVLIVEQ